MLLRLLERLGRCEALIDPRGEIMALRYFLLRKEGGQKSFASDWLPNIWLHKMLLDHSPDNGFIHRHPWATVSLILSGGYVERLEDGRVKALRRGSVSARSSTMGHCIEVVTPNTWSVFAHWFKRHDWEFVQTDKSILSFHEHIQKFGVKNIHKWVMFNAEGKKQIQRRQQAAIRLKKLKERGK